MLGKDWTYENFNNYAIWLEETLFNILQNYDLTRTKKIIKYPYEFRDKLKSSIIDYQGDFIMYLIQSNIEKRDFGKIILFDTNYIDDIDMIEFFFSILEKDSKISIDNQRYINGLKLLLSEFLGYCGYGDVVPITVKEFFEEEKREKDWTYRLNNLFNDFLTEKKNTVKPNDYADFFYDKIVPLKGFIPTKIYERLKPSEVNIYWLYRIDKKISWQDSYDDNIAISILSLLENGYLDPEINEFTNYISDGD